MRIAVIGTGIAGNVVAHRLSKEYDVTVFEANDYIGGHSNTITVPTADGDLQLDTGFLVFNDRTYPNFVDLLDELGVESQESSMSFSVKCAGSGLEYNGSTINSLFAQRSNLLRPSFYRMIRDILRFNREAPELLDCNDIELSLADYLGQQGYSEEFVRQYLIPMGAAIWSAEPDTMAKMPAAFFVRFFHNHGLLSVKDRPVWRVIRGGSREYVRKLVDNHRDRIRLNCPVSSVTRQPGRGVLIRSGGMEAESFDYVFLACHSDQALRLLKDALPIERQVLGAIPYQRNEAILHTDETLMPTRKLAWGAWNYHIPQADNPAVTVTYHLNRLQGLETSKQYFVTLNSDRPIRSGAVLKRITYEHPVFNIRSVAAQQRYGEINGLNRTFYCGAYWRNGFHEDGVVSALAALAQFDGREEDAQQYFLRAS
jgi:predicted NAD/FAD-binding protein